ncbi:MAG: glycine--tRNA ligase [Puniceicoccales bacterium]|jgi:glycyl-tRNA synthetase|nr:glycine--tRNA ligase [Puniceicoccales bacterium]
MDSILSLCRRRGFIFQSSEIYGGVAGFFDYGPIGCELKRNIKDLWWRDVVRRREDIVGIDCSTIMHPQVWKASGHADGFADPMVDCRESKMRYRADQLYFAPVSVDGKMIGYISQLEDVGMQTLAEESAQRLKAKRKIQGKMDPIQLRTIAEANAEELAQIPSPTTGNPGTLTAPRQFNLMFTTHIGAVADAASMAYLRPETAQGIFVNFKNIVDSTRVKLPFGIAQIGRAYRNEITPRNFTFRSREFEQMELEYFIAPDADWQSFHREWVETRLHWYLSLGIRRELLGQEVHAMEKLAHYARACTDITFAYPFGIQEIEGIAARGNFDLTCHQQCSGKSLEFFDEDTQQRYLPHVIEPSAGVDRVFLAVLCSAYDEDELNGERRTVLRLSPQLAPIKAGIFPLQKNKPELVQLSRSIFENLQRHWNVHWDATGAIGRRYRRMDEVGTPYAITVDFDSLENGTVTLRERDSAEQSRVAIAELVDALREKLD